MTIDPTTTPYSGDPGNYVETTYLPSDATEGKAQTFNTPYQAALDNSAYLRARLLLDPKLIPLAGAQQTEYTATTGPVPRRFSYWPISPTVPNFERGGWVQTDVTDGGGLWWWVQISPEVVVTMVAASIMGDDGPGFNSGFPGATDRPSMKLYRQSVDGSIAELLLTLADETTSKAQYEAHHTIPLNPTISFVTPLAFAAGEHLLIQFIGHKGGLVAANTLKLYGIEITTALPPT